METAPSATAEILASALRDPLTDERTELVIAWLLSRVQDERAIPILSKNFGVSTETARELVLNAAKEFGAKIIPAAREALTNGDTTTRTNAAELLVGLGGSDAYEILWSRYPQELDAKVRYLILLGIASDPREIALDRLALVLDDRDEAHRDLAWTALKSRLPAGVSLQFDVQAERKQRRAQIAEIRRQLVSR